MINLIGYFYHINFKIIKPERTIDNDMREFKGNPSDTESNCD